MGCTEVIQKCKKIIYSSIRSKPRQGPWHQVHNAWLDHLRSTACDGVVQRRVLPPNWSRGIREVVFFRCSWAGRCKTSGRDWYTKNLFSSWERQKGILWDEIAVEGRPRSSSYEQEAVTSITSQHQRKLGKRESYQSTTTSCKSRSLKG